MMGAVPATAVPAARPSPPAAALRELLQQLTTMLLGIPAEVYVATCARSSGSIGSHVRHVLDHVATLIASGGTAELSYDRRTRGTAVESDPAAAIREILRVQHALERWSSTSMDEPVVVTAMVSASGASVTGWSSRARELAFVVSHTIHHQAVIALLLEMQGGEPPGDRFGYAPSTPRS